MQSKIIDTSIHDFLQKDLHSLFSKTRKLHNDYWYIWVKSGLLDFVCLKIRKKYNIPILKEKDDYQSIEICVDDNDTTTLDKHLYYDALENKDIVKKEIESVITQLRLHRAAFWSLFNKIFYNKPLRINEKWEGFDSDSIFGFKNLWWSKDFPFVGYTGDELKEIERMISDLNVNSNSSKLSKKQIRRSIEDWCKQLKRDIRVIKDKEKTCLVVCQMKNYKSLVTTRNEDNDVVDNVLMTSGKCADEVYSRLRSNKDLKATWFRKMAQHLYENFPLLKEYISTK